MTLYYADPVNGNILLPFLADASSRNAPAHLSYVDNGSGVAVPVSTTNPRAVGTGMLRPSATITRSTGTGAYTNAYEMVGGGTGGYVASTGAVLTVGTKYMLSDVSLISSNTGSPGTSGAGGFGFRVFVVNGTMSTSGTPADYAAVPSVAQYTGGANWVGSFDVVYDALDPFSDALVGSGSLVLPVNTLSFVAAATNLSIGIITTVANYQGAVSETLKVTFTLNYGFI